jgi:hypothetical protein
MKRKFVNILSILSAFILIANCTNKIKDKKDVTTQPIIRFPFVSPDSLKISGSELRLTYIDSTPFYNPIVSKQAALIYTMQREPDTISFEKILFKIKLPNRENSVVEYSINRKEFYQIERIISHPQLKHFYKEFLELNWNSRENYREDYTSLLDRTNMIFAHEIDKNFKEQIAENSTWYGFDSFIVFHNYFIEVENNQIGISTKLVESIQSSEDYLTESDKQKLVKIIEKHTERIGQI